MRIVIDLQPCQNGSRHRGIGRYSMAMTKAIITLGRDHEFIILLNETFHETVGDVRKELAGLVPQDAFVLFSVPDATASAEPTNAWRNRTAEMARSYFIESLSPDLVFIPSLNEGLWDETLVSVEKSAPYPTAITLYDLIPLEDPDAYFVTEDGWNGYLRRLDQIRRADLILPISEYVARDGAARLGLDPAKLVVAYCGVEPKFVPPAHDPAAKAKLLTDYGITRPYMMAASPAEARKNLDGLIAGFAHIAADIRDAHQIVLFGKMDAAARKHLTELAANEGLPEGTLLLPGYAPDEDLPALYHYSSVFAFPSFSEGFGLPLLEAMASGAPVVGSNKTSIPEVIGRDDLMCDPADTVAIGRIIERILSQPELERELRAFGPRRAAAFTWEKSAAIVLSAFEKLVADRAPPLATGEPVVPARQNAGLPTLAFVMPDVSIEHRLAGVNSGLASALADLFDVTIIANEFAPHNDWAAANSVTRDFDWFDSHAGAFDHVLYGTDFMADARFRRLMRSHGGSSIVFEKLSAAPRERLTGPRLFGGAQLALVEQEGLGALSMAAEGTVSADDVAAILHRDIAERTAVFEEADSRFAPTGGQLGIVPVALSDQGASAFRTRIGIDDEAELVIAIVAHEQAADEVVKRFRERPLTSDAEGFFLVFTADPDAKNALDAKRMFGNVMRMSGELDLIYCGMLSAANAVIFDSQLSQQILNRLEIDAPNGHRLILAEQGLPDTLSVVRAPSRNEKSRAASIGDSDIVGITANKHVAVALKALILQGDAARAESALDAFARRLPAQVRGIVPDSDDLAALAISLARNERHAGPNYVYIDVTAFAGTSFTHRLDLPTRMLLQALFRQGGRRVKAVYADGDKFITANRFVAKLCGLADAALPDEEMVARGGDHILGFERFHAFGRNSLRALEAAQNRGISIDYVVLGRAALDREDIMPALANMLLVWTQDIGLETSTRLSALPRDEETPRATWTDNAPVERIAALVKAGLYTNILLCDGGIDAASSPEWPVTELPPRVVEAHDKWVAARSAPPPPNARSAKTAADFGHVVTGHILGSYSLALVNRMLARTLEQRFPGQVRFLPVETNPLDHTEGVPADDKALMVELTTRPAMVDRDEIVVSHHYPVLVPKGNYRLSMAVFFWEESQIPAATIKQLSDNFDVIISPTQVVTNALFGSGLSIPVATIGQPIIVDRYTPLASTRKAGGRTTNFLHVSSCFQRKGADIMLSAWAKAFTAVDKVRLVIKTFPNPHNDMAEQLAALRAANQNLAEIVLVDEDVDAADMPAFYADADVMVLPTRGEGYNLPALEAMAAGLPLIVTGYGGHRNFCGEQEARLLKYSFVKSGSHLGSHHSLWVEPDVDDLVAALREQIDPAEAPAIEARREQAIVAATRESDEAAWLGRYAMIVRELQDNSYRKPARVAWVGTWAVQCGIAEYSNYLINNMSAAARREILVVCDTRTPPDDKAPVSFQPSWDAQNVPKTEQMLERIEDYRADAVVIQHQDGLLSWQQLGVLARDHRLANKVSIAVLHNAGALASIDEPEQAIVVSGLSRLSRVLVHNLADVNFLASLGLEHNVGLFAHGAFATDQAPWPRPLTVTDTPIIGCHGFFFRHKAIDKLIRAAALLRKEWPRLRLRLVNARFPEPGFDAYIRECRSLASELGMADAIEWHQDFLPIEEIRDLLGGCDVITLPYEESSDSTSGAVRGSITTMVPLVATKVKIFAELGNAAAWADSNDPEVLADTIAQLLRSPERRRSVQAAMHDWLIAHDWKTVAATLEGMIHGLVKQKRLGWDQSSNESSLINE